LSYTNFQYSAAEASAKSLSAKVLNELLRHRASGAKQVIALSARVTNSGKVAAEEVVQLYVGLRGTSVEEPVRALKGFKRVTLGPGERKKVTFSLDADAFALWDIRNQRAVEPCQVRIWVSPNAATDEPVALEIGE
jgi:beta-glucosidase